MSLSPPTELIAQAAVLGVSLDGPQVHRLSGFVDLLLAANARFNLTTIREPSEAWSRHVLDSLSLVPHLQLKPGARVVDVGAGGGLPGLPLAIACPELHFTLIDATGKKVRYIAETAERLGLDNVTAVQGRAEELAAVGAELREHFDLATARALAPLPVLLELVVPFIKVGARFLAIKGERAPQELAEAQAALQQLHMRVSGQHRTPTGTILALQKTAQTPRRYPRRSGEPKRLPIGKDRSKPRRKDG